MKYLGAEQVAQWVLGHTRKLGIVRVVLMTYWILANNQGHVSERWELD